MGISAGDRFSHSGCMRSVASTHCPLNFSKEPVDIGEFTRSLVGWGLKRAGDRKFKFSVDTGTRLTLSISISAIGVGWGIVNE